ncbi:large proline-rich protein bag6-A isoform X1 [Frankliniella occidentalis]|uniref:Large proline-rich protein BAG6 n=1 Tax=Frankliniella occidentalis TaxID=133901 RepID=A0A6J1SF52_FRAOC|nr:large proline-rich protein bag6-A isoform X1 [Frankliniella occidentalis]
MIDLTVKTLDSRNHAFSMPDDATVLQLKTKIEETMSIPANRQRLIFQGRVMQDDKKLSEYEVHGMVIHLVKSQPPQPGSRPNGSNSSNSTSSSENANRSSGARYFGRVDGGTMFGSVLIPVVGETGSGRNRAWRIMHLADRMIQRATEVLDNHENSASRSTSAAASATTTPYNSSRDSSGSHSPATEPSQPGRGATSEARTNAATTTTASSEPAPSQGGTAMDTEMDTDNNPSTPHITVSSADQAGASSSTNTAGSSQDGSSADSNQQRLQRGTPSTSNMAALMTKLRALQTRFDPLLTRYHNLITEDSPTNNPQQLAERLSLTQTVPEVLHLLSHAYHAISELTIDWELAPPRQMRPLLAPAIQQLVQLTEGMNTWGLTIPPPAFGQPAQTAAANAGNSTATSGSTASSSASASTSSSSAPPSASASSGSSGTAPEVTYMTTTFPAEGGEATTTFTTRPAANFETAPGASNTTGNGSTSNRSPVVTASIDISNRNPGLNAALSAALALANRLATHPIPHQAAPSQQQQQQQPPQQQQDQQQQPNQPQAQQPQQPQQAQQSRGGSIVTLPVGMIDIPTNVEFFMEVGPSTITIDSLEATMVTSGSFTPGTNGTTDGNPLNMHLPWGGHPQDFLQGVVHALNGIITPNLRRRGSAPESTQNPNLQRRGSAPESETDASSSANANVPAAGSTPSASSSPGATGGQTSQARGYTATHPTTSTQTRSTARPQVHHIATAPFPGLQVGGFTDPFLPCHSQFFASWRRSRPNTNSSSSTTANSATQTNSSAPSNIAPASGPSVSSANASGSASSAASSSSSTQNLSQNLSGPNALQNLIESLFRPVSLVGPETAFQNILETLTSRNPSTGGDMWSSLATASQENGIDVPIINWISPGSTQQEGESLLSDLRLTIVRSVTVSDLMALVEGNWAAINHVRNDLRHYVVQHLCEGSPTEENLERGTNLLMTELRPHFNIITEGALREDIDAVATLSRFHESVIPEFLKLVLDDDHASTFGQNLHDMYYKYLSNLFAIIKHCCANNDAIETVFQSCLNRITEGGSLISVAARSCLEQLNSVSGNVPFEDIQPYIVCRTTVEETVPVPSHASTSTESCTPPECMKMEQSLENPVCESSATTIEPMDTDSQSPHQPTTSASSVSLDVPSHSSEGATAAHTIESSEIAPMDTELPAPAPEAWHRILPPEWVPIITRDATRQRRPNSQAPLSDAYLAGMPPKRRKVVTASRPHGSLSEVISANMESAIQSSGVPTAGLSLVQEEAGRDPRLREAYREQLRATVRANLANNPDFSAERFPNAAQYFGKS